MTSSLSYILLEQLNEVDSCKLLHFNSLSEYDSESQVYRYTQLDTKNVHMLGTRDNELVHIMGILQDHTETVRI
jgi:hypothetical protein